MPGKTVVLRNNDTWAGATSSEAEAESAEGRREGLVPHWPLGRLRLHPPLSTTSFPRMENPSVFSQVGFLSEALSICECSRTDWEMCPERPAEVLYSGCWKTGSMAPSPSVTPNCILMELLHLSSQVSGTISGSGRGNLAARGSQ